MDATDAGQLPDDPMGQLAALPDMVTEFLTTGGPTIWAIAGLSVITVALILWKIWRLALIGAWSRGKARDAVALFEAGREAEAKAMVAGRRGLRSKVIHGALEARENFPEDAAREETTRVARREIGQAGSGLRPLELIATIAPLLGLLGTVLGMIAAFQALQEAGARADPATLAGGIWEALLTTAAGMAVAIPASAALAWFEGIVDAMAADVEDGVTRIFVAGRRLPEPAATALPAAAE
ncbi:MAG: MotA/TolQ/ExbB proton channel family protein [Tropicimonas sp.]|uniref:MotA/TolQ/ExbB proton channel family protein n=1 Tax=Tropicimonas sp. TaxID=2067044 RepID=UPI003A898DDA